MRATPTTAMLTTLLCAAALSGCQSNDPQPSAKPQPPVSGDRPPDPVAAPPAHQSRPYEGPPVRAQVLALQTAPEQFVATIEVTVPTGGWKLALDKGEVEAGVARVYLTLEK